MKKTSPGTILKLCEAMNTEIAFLTRAGENLKLYQQSLPEALADDGYAQLNRYTGQILKYVQEGTESIAVLSRELQDCAERLVQIRKMGGNPRG